MVCSWVFASEYYITHLHMDKLVLTSRCVMPKESQRRLNEDYNIHKRKIE
jgi:hypothetical protein